MEIAFSIIGLLLALVTFLFKRKYDEMSRLKILHELFTYYNDKYDNLNNVLNMIVERKETKLSDDEKKEKIKDYLNLCSEEYYWYRRGLIDKDIWENWVTGMCYFFKDEFIKQVIKQEQSNRDSYYGFFEIIEAMCIKNKEKKNEK